MMPLIFKTSTGLCEKNEFDCFQVGALRTYINMITNMVEIQFGKLMTYIFKQLDIDGNGQIMIEEFQKMHVPCSFLIRGELDSNTGRKRCYDIAEEIVEPFGAVRFPDLEMRPRRRDDVVSIVDKVANAACEILT